LPGPSSSLALISVYPQPFNADLTSGTWAKISSPAGQNAEMRLYDLKGRLIAPVKTLSLKAGVNTVSLDILLQIKPGPGCYLLTIHSGTQVVSKKVMIL